MEKNNPGVPSEGAGDTLDIKGRIVEALDYIQKLTIPRSGDWEKIEEKKKEIESEKDEARLFAIYRVLQESLVRSEEGKVQTLKVKMPDGSIKEYDSLEDFYRRGPRDASPQDEERYASREPISNHDSVENN